MKLPILIVSMIFGVLFMSPVSVQATPAASTSEAPVVSGPVPVPKAVQEHDKAETLQAYLQPSYANFARTLWALNAHRTDNNQAIDNFLMISECGLYTRFYNNEFEWKRIREATREYLAKYKGSFSRDYEYVQPIFLDRYDFSLKGFKLMPKSVFVTSRRLEIEMHLNANAICRDLSYKNIKGYPSTAMVILDEAFMLNFIRVNEDLAQEYLKIIAKRNIETDNGRPAYIRFRVRFNRYVGGETLGYQDYGMFAGALQTIEVFADPDLMFKLYMQDFN